MNTFFSLELVLQDGPASLSIASSHSVQRVMVVSLNSRLESNKEEAEGHGAYGIDQGGRPNSRMRLARQG